MLESPFDGANWYHWFAWTLDYRGAWIEIMTRTCRPVWIMFGDSTKQETSRAMEELAEVAYERGFEPDANPTGDVDFIYANAKSLGGVLLWPEFGSPNSAAISSVVRTPAHILYVAGMEYKRVYGFVDKARAEELCDEIVEAMEAFKEANSSGECVDSAVLALSNVTRQWYGGSTTIGGTANIFSLSVEYEWEGLSQTSTTPGNFSTDDQMTWNGSYASSIAGTFEESFEDTFVWTGSPVATEAGGFSLDDNMAWNGTYEKPAETVEFALEDLMAWNGTYEKPAEAVEFSLADLMTWYGTSQKPYELPEFTLSDTATWSGTQQEPYGLPEFTLSDTATWNGTQQEPYGLPEFTLSDTATWNGSSVAPAAGAFTATKTFIIIPGGGTGTINY